ncbi:BrnT family toxin [Breoghania sp. L-A4]|uniref:BrnT family toxin n=1 Tax=Breoghania sp. L-A4 TaxID=2304600 RepID=UPI0020C0330C|nr:BrnT family toxin [Breoghania sp. L-A4]
MNIAKHGVGFGTACRIFEGVVLTAEDRRFDYGERRFISIGIIDGIAILTVAHTDRADRIRLISARPASRKERKHYEEALQRRTEP